MTQRRRARFVGWSAESASWLGWPGRPGWPDFWRPKQMTKGVQQEQKQMASDE